MSRPASEPARTPEPDLTIFGPRRADMARVDGPAPFGTGPREGRDRCRAGGNTTSARAAARACLLWKTDDTSATVASLVVPEGVSVMEKQRSRCPRPPGAPRWVAMFHEPARDTWTVAAESPYQGPVRYAVGDMTRTVRARGDEAAVALWGPEDGAWRLFDTPSATAPAPERPAPGSPEPARLVERMTDRRHQVLMAGLSTAGLYDLGPEDDAAVRALAERLDEPTVRRVAHWLSAAGGGR